MTSLNCPHCKTALNLEHQYGAHHCSQCEGGFVTTQTLANLLRETRGSRPSKYKPPGLDLSAPIIRLNCPQCDTPMLRKNYGEASGVIVDICRVHGIWFDRRELAQVLAFAASGAMDNAEASAQQRMVGHKRLDDFAYRLRHAGPIHHGAAGRMMAGRPIELSDLGAEPQPRAETEQVEFVIELLDLVELI